MTGHEAHCLERWIGVTYNGRIDSFTRETSEGSNNWAVIMNGLVTFTYPWEFIALRLWELETWRKS